MIIEDNNKKIITIGLACFFISLVSLNTANGQWQSNGSEIYYNSGKVGVGVSSDLSRVLTIGGGIDLYGEGESDVGLLLYRPQESGSNNTRWFLRANLSNNSSYPYLTNRTPAGKVVIKTGTASGGGENAHFTLEGGDGVVESYFEKTRLGIGTTNPTEPLHVYEPNNTSTGQTMRLDADVDQNPNVVFSSNGQNMANIRVKDSGSDQLQFMVGSSLDEAMSITPAGNVGIGTVNPSNLLTVNGIAKAEEVIVEENVGADFVFEEDYILPELKEVESHILNYKHLPGIPSAEEMKKNGIKVGHLQMKLLQKIEELTLYAISQKEKISSQRKVVKQLIKRVERLEKELNNE